MGGDQTMNNSEEVVRLKMMFMMRDTKNTMKMLVKDCSNKKEDLSLKKRKKKLKKKMMMKGKRSIIIIGESILDSNNNSHSLHNRVVRIHNR